MAELAGVIEQARVVIVQAPSEGVELEATFGQGAMRGVEWVPNGATVDANLSTDGDRDIDVLVVGRIEERKNQLHVAQSLAGSDLKTMFVGGVNPRSRRYNTAFQSVVLRSSNLTYLPHVEMSVLRKLYCRSRILLGASHFEVVSLAELEAVAYGCQLVTGTSGYIADYLGGLATYLTPTAPPHQLLDTLERVSAAGVNQAGMQLVRSQYTWDRSAQILRDVYRRYGLL
jgi:glycosyltransferase involved in cell wall biosynthesis